MYQARRRKQIFLNDWKTRLDDFPQFNERAVLPDGGRVSRGHADRKAVDEYERLTTPIIRDSIEIQIPPTVRLALDHSRLEHERRRLPRTLRLQREDDPRSRHHRQ